MSRAAMKRSMVWLPLTVAVVMWFVMFSPWISGDVNFWPLMAASGVVLGGVSLWLCGGLRESLRRVAWSDVVLGVALGALLWCIFWVGDKVATWMFPFAEGEIGNIYSMRDGTSYLTIGLLLTFVIGPAEELFWRGYFQRTLSERWGANVGYVVATLTYALVHIWSFNFMLVVAALVAGAVWGLAYRLWPGRMWMLVVSHAVWDVAVFLIFPI